MVQEISKRKQNMIAPIRFVPLKDPFIDHQFTYFGANDFCQQLNHQNQSLCQVHILSLIVIQMVDIISM